MEQYKMSRYEIKYIISDEVMRKLLNELQVHMESDPHQEDGVPYPIYNLYLDTEHHTLIRKSLDKPIYKEKIRIRSYDPWKLDGLVFLEIKKKYKGITNKRRVLLPLKSILHWLDDQQELEVDANQIQVLSEVEAIVKREKLNRREWISYSRLAYFSHTDRNLRISFDKDIFARRNGEWLRLLPEGKWIMEIKVLGAIPLWLTSLLTKYDIKKTSFSKYGKAYEFKLENGGYHYA